MPDTSTQPPCYRLLRGRNEMGGGGGGGGLGGFFLLFSATSDYFKRWLKGSLWWGGTGR